MNLKDYIREVPDFPKKGISFKDITTLLKNPAAFDYCVHALLERFHDVEVDSIGAVESRGFLFAAPMALRLGVPLVLFRKPGKLPAETARMEYALEYGTDAVEIHLDAVGDGDRFLVIDDLLATGGTAAAACSLVEKIGGRVAGVGFVVELVGLGGRKRLSGYKVESLVEYVVEE